MFKQIKGCIDYAKQTFENCMSLPDWNSRLVFLITGLTACVSMLALVVGFMLRAKDVGAYPEMVMALGGTGAGAAIGRFMTKKATPKPTEKDDTEKDDN